MKIRVLLSIVAGLFCYSVVQSQPLEQQVLDAYFNYLTRQHQLHTAISSELLQISPEMHGEYQAMEDLSDEEETLSWTYFIEKLGRLPGSEDLLAQCRLEHKINRLIGRFHGLRLVDPFSQSIVDTAQAVERLRFFGIQTGDRVAEIGFGYGYNLSLLGLAYDSLQVYANELDDYRLHKMEQEIREIFTDDRADQFHFIPGALASTQLEGQELDLIIMENVLHHIEMRTDFIQSMIASLDIEGTVVIMEEFSETIRAGGQCPDLMSRTTLEELFRRAGFRLEHEAELGYKTMLRFTLGQRSE